MKFDYLKIFFLTIFLFLGLFFGLKTEAYNWTASIINPPVIAGQLATLKFHFSGAILNNMCVTTNFGDGTNDVKGSCWSTLGCDVSLPHVYDFPGTYLAFGFINACGLPGICESNIPGMCPRTDFNISITVNPAPSPTPYSHPNLNPLRYEIFGALIEGIFTVIFWATIVLAPLLIVAGGVLMLLAGANPNNIALGKKIMLYTAVIFVVILILKIMISYFKGDLTFH